MIDLGRRGATKWQQKHMLCSYTSILDPLVLNMAVKSVDNIHICVRPYSLVAFV